MCIKFFFKRIQKIFTGYWSRQISQRIELGKTLRCYLTLFYNWHKLRNLPKVQSQQVVEPSWFACSIFSITIFKILSYFTSILPQLGRIQYYFSPTDMSKSKYTYVFVYVYNLPLDHEFHILFFRCLRNIFCCYKFVFIFLQFT